MNVERLRTILQQLRTELDVAHVEESLNHIDANLQLQVNQPNQPSYQTEVEKGRQNLLDGAKNAPSRDFGPVWLHSVTELKLDKFTAPAIADQVEAIFQRAGVTPVVVLNEIRPLLQSVRETKTRISQIIDSLNFLGIKESEIPEGEAEVGVMIPRSIVDTLDELGDEASDLYRLLNIIAEAATGEVEHIEIDSVSTSDILIYVHTSMQTASVVADSLKHIINCYAELIGVRMMLEKLKQMKYKSESMRPLQDEARERMNATITKTGERILKKYPTGNAGRKNELKQLVIKALWALADRIDDGYSFDVRAKEPTEEDADPGAREAAASINNARKDLQFIKEGDEKLLQLPPGAADLSEADTVVSEAKPAGKKTSE